MSYIGAFGITWCLELDFNVEAWILALQFINSFVMAVKAIVFMF